VLPHLLGETTHHTGAWLGYRRLPGLIKDDCNVPPTK
jgi:hypothetical protein